MKGNKVRFNSIDEYISTFPAETQRLLQEVRETIRTAAPKAGEKISYGIPTFILNDTYLIYFAGWKNHISVYPIPSGSETFNKQVSKYMAGKGTLKFPIDKPLPLKLIKQIVKYRLAENRKRTDDKKYPAATKREILDD